jgi:hypothetical protein
MCNIIREDIVRRGFESESDNAIIHGNVIGQAAGSTIIEKETHPTINRSSVVC